MDNNTEQLALSAPLFDRMKEEDINVILASSKMQKFAAGQIVARENDEQAQLCSIKKGSVKIFSYGRLATSMQNEFLYFLCIKTDFRAGTLSVILRCGIAPEQSNRAGLFNRLPWQCLC